MPISREAFFAVDIFKHRNIFHIVKVYEFLKENPNKAFMTGEIAKDINILTQQCSTALKKLRKADLVFYKSPYYLYNERNSTGSTDDEMLKHFGIMPKQKE